MTCPMCGGDTKILETRSNEDSIKRRRKCLDCGYRFLTLEVDKDFYERLVKINARLQQIQN